MDWSSSRFVINRGPKQWLREVLGDDMGEDEVSLSVTKVDEQNSEIIFGWVEMKRK